MIRKVLLFVVGGAVLLGAARNVAVDPAAGLLGLLVLVAVAYVVRCAAPTLSGHLRAVGVRLFGGRHRSARGEGVL